MDIDIKSSGNDEYTCTIDSIVYAKLSWQQVIDLLRETEVLEETNEQR